MKRRALLGIVVLVVLLIGARLALAPRWDSRINNEHYVAYADGAQLVLCAEGMVGPAFFNLLERMHLLVISDNNSTECLYVNFASAPTPGTYSLNGVGHLVTSGIGEARPFTPQRSSMINTLWFERTCFCRVTDEEAAFSGELIIDSTTPLAGRLKLDIAEPKNTISIDAPLAAFNEGSVSELRRREDFRRQISK